MREQPRTKKAALRKREPSGAVYPREVEVGTPFLPKQKCSTKAKREVVLLSLEASRKFAWTRSSAVLAEINPILL
jgi:hypothetical protein